MMRVSVLGVKTVQPFASREGAVWAKVGVAMPSKPESDMKAATKVTGLEIAINRRTGWRKCTHDSIVKFWVVSSAVLPFDIDVIPCCYTKWPMIAPSDLKSI